MIGQSINIAALSDAYTQKHETGMTCSCDHLNWQTAFGKLFALPSCSPGSHYELKDAECSNAAQSLPCLICCRRFHVDMVLCSD